MSRSRLIFMVFVVTAILLFTVHLRILSGKAFYRYRSAYVQNHRLRQQLWQRQLEIENMSSPAHLPSMHAEAK